jgi:hypothetical protein
MTDPELESFKRQIDMRAYAAEHGYQLDRKESWRGSSVLRNPATDDKIIVKRSADGHYIYFSVRDETDNGSIIDFVKNRQNKSLGEVRKELRPWIGRAATLPPFPELPKTSKDRIRVETDYARMTDAVRHPYLENERGIPAHILGSPRFLDRIRMDPKHDNAVFPHFDRQGLCGFEIKNFGFTGFASGGSKGLWSSHERAEDNRAVFCESAIDALSHAVLFPDEHTRYFSIGGQLNPVQPELMRAAAAAMPRNSAIVAAMDADPEGGRLAEAVRVAVELSGRDDLSFVFQEPVGYKDWNDQVRRKGKPPLPVRLDEPSVA